VVKRALKEDDKKSERRSPHKIDREMWERKGLAQSTGTQNSLFVGKRSPKSKTSCGGEKVDNRVKSEYRFESSQGKENLTNDHNAAYSSRGGF